jgi:hypothetical protein
MGVIVGALISTGTQVWLDRQKQLVVVRRAKRLVAQELMQNCTALDVLTGDEPIDFEIVGPVLDQLLPILAWEVYRPDLASTLNHHDWQMVLNGYSTINVLRTLLQAHRLHRSGLGVDAGEGVNSMRAAMKGSVSTLEMSIRAPTGEKALLHELDGS